MCNYLTADELKKLNKKQLNNLIDGMTREELVAYARRLWGEIFSSFVENELNRLTEAVFASAFGWKNPRKLGRLKNVAEVIRRAIVDDRICWPPKNPKRSDYILMFRELLDKVLTRDWDEDWLIF